MHFPSTARESGGGTQTNVWLQAHQNIGGERMVGVETGCNRVGQNTVGGGLEAKDDYREGNTETEHMKREDRVRETYRKRDSGGESRGLKLR